MSRGIELDDGARLKSLLARYPVRVMPAIVFHWYLMERFVLLFDGRCFTNVADLNLIGIAVIVNGVKGSGGVAGDC
jgi:hypothetical protein